MNTRQVLFTTTIIVAGFFAPPQARGEQDVEGAIHADLNGHSTVEIMTMKAQYQRIAAVIASGNFVHAVALDDSVRSVGINVVDAAYARLKTQKVKTSQYEIAVTVETRAGLEIGFLRYSPPTIPFWKILLEVVLPVIAGVLVEKFVSPREKSRLRT